MACLPSRTAPAEKGWKNASLSQLWWRRMSGSTPAFLSGKGNMIELPIILSVDDKGNREDHYHQVLTGLYRPSGQGKMVRASYEPRRNGKRNRVERPSRQSCVDALRRALRAMQ